MPQGNACPNNPDVWGKPWKHEPVEGIDLRIVSIAAQIADVTFYLCKRCGAVYGLLPEFQNIETVLK